MKNKLKMLSLVFFILIGCISNSKIVYAAEENFTWFETAGPKYVNAYINSGNGSIIFSGVVTTPQEGNFTVTLQQKVWYG